MLVGVDGEVQINGVVVPPGMPRNYMKARDTLLTGWGRAVVQIAAGVTLQIGERSAIRVAPGRSGEIRIDLVEGAMVLLNFRSGSERRNSAVVAYRNVEISSLRPSAYRVDANPAELRVRSGKVLVESGGRRVEVGEGRTLALDGSLAVGKFRQAKADPKVLGYSGPVGYLAPPPFLSPPATYPVPLTVSYRFPGNPVSLSDFGLWQGWQKPPGIAEQNILRTYQGRAQILLNPSTRLLLGEGSSVRTTSSPGPGFAFELVKGTAVLTAAQKSSVVISRGGEKVSFLKPGLYRLDAEPDELRVFAGQAVVESGGGLVKVEAGTRIVLAGVLAARGFDRDGTDAFGLWPAWRAAYPQTPSWEPSGGNSGSAVAMQQDVHFGFPLNVPDIGVGP